MRRCTAYVLLWLLLLGRAQAAYAEDVRIEHLGLDLLARYEPVEMVLEAPAQPAILIVHGALAHHEMELVRALQAGFKAKKIGSLAITLSLGLDARRGMFNCALEQDHRMSDAVGEIEAWVGWLKARHPGPITLLGHSRGAAQVALYAAGGAKAGADQIVLLAPPSLSEAREAARYRESFGADLGQLVGAARKLVEDGEEDTILDLPGFLTCKPARVTAGAFLDYYDANTTFRLASVLPRIKLPVLVIAGTADEVSPDVALEVKKVESAPVALVTIDGADHFFRDLYAEDVVDRTAAFLKGQ